MTLITAEAFFASLDKAIALKGEDYIYPGTLPESNDPGCYYSTKDGEPSCIIGHIIADLAPEAFDKIVEIENSTGESNTVTNLDEWNLLNPDGPEPGITFESVELLAAARLAQLTQDLGKPWGVAREEARQRYER